MSWRLVTSYCTAGASVCFVAIEKGLVGAIAVADAPRPTSLEGMAKLKVIPIQRASLHFCHLIHLRADDIC